MEKCSLTDAEILERFYDKYWIDGDCYSRDDCLWCAFGEHIVDADEHWSKNGFSGVGDCMRCTREKELREQDISSDSIEEEEEEDSD